MVNGDGKGIKNGLMPEPRTIHCESFTAATELCALASITKQASRKFPKIDVLGRPHPRPGPRLGRPRPKNSQKGRPADPCHQVESVAF